MQEFIKELKQFKKLISKNTIKTLRGQALAGDLLGARKGLEKLKIRMKRGESDVKQ